MDVLMKTFGFVNKGPTFNLKIGSLFLQPTYINALLIIFLLFLLVLTMASMRRHFMSWSVKGAVFGVFLGFLLALIMEGFLLIGGKTAMIELLGWKNPPKPVSTALDLGKEKLIQVLGTDTTIPLTKAQVGDASETLSLFQSLSSGEKEKVKAEICR
jgi:hypothetical protein